MSLFVENDIDGDAFCLLDKNSLRAMIKSQGLILKFEKKFKQLKNNGATSSSEVCEDETDVESSLDPEKSRSSKPLSDEIIKEQSKIYGRNAKGNTRE